MTSSGAQPRTSSASKTDTSLRALSEVRPSDRVLWALPLPSPGLDAQVIEAARLSHAQRLHAVRERAITVVVATPSDALRLVEQAAREQVDLADSTVRLVVVGGEPGGSVPSTRRRIEERFGARVRDMYVVGAVVVGWQCPIVEDGVHLHESYEADAGDVVQVTQEPCACGRPVLQILGRKEELLNVRGVELLPSTIENIVRRHPAVTEYRLDAYHVRGACEVAIEIEPDEAVASEGDRARVAAEVAQDLKRSLGLRLQCEAVPHGSLPRDDPRPRRLLWRN